MSRVVFLTLLFLAACGGDKGTDTSAVTDTDTDTDTDIETDTDTECDDSDGDGACDDTDPCPDDPLDDSDGDGSCDSIDLCTGDDNTGDTDSDGVCDDTDICPEDELDDSDNDGSCDSDDLCTGDDTTGDTDLDGVCDDTDLCPDDILDDSDGDGSCDSDDLCLGDDTTGDTDLDGVCDDTDLCPNDALDDSDADGSCDSDDLCTGDDTTGDTDLDGVCDDIDTCPVDALDDSDGDGSCDSDDLCTGDDATGDTDGDGACDDTDPCPDDVGDDSDGDGSCDGVDLCTGDDATGDTDGDGACDDTDPCPDDVLDDSDGDGSCDGVDLCAGNDASGDIDADGLCADVDICDDRWNPGQEDVCDVWFVDDDAAPGGDGTRWSTAFASPEAAVLAAAAGQEVWIAQGLYTPSQANGDFVAAFDVDFYGGFDGTEMLMADRAGLFHETVISGDHLGDDDGTLGAKADNSEHVFTANGTVTLDGLVIADGNQTGVFGGSGVFAGVAATLNVRNCIIRDHDDDRSGAGIDYRSAAGGVVEDTVFLRVVANQGGAAIEASVTDTLAIRNVAIIDAETGNLGAAAAIQTGSSGSVTLDNVSIYGADADPAIAHGGGALTVRNSAIYGHSSALYDVTGNAVVTSVCADEDLSGYSGTNLFLDGLSVEYGDPFTMWGTRLLLAQTGSGDAFTSACVDAGSNVQADLYFPEWSVQTTGRDEVVDATPVDAGAHYMPEATLCIGDDASGDTDGDGRCDDLDPCPADDPDDSDGDSVCDSDDVCDGFDDTLDADADGIPDDCDICEGDDASGDVDGDGLCLDLETSLGSDDTSLDSDGDMLDDADEYFNHGTEPGDPDSDNGGMKDGHEIAVGNDPNAIGDDFAARTVFVTSSTQDADLGGMGGADTLCDDLASAAGLYGDDWAAFLSDASGRDARDRIDPATYVGTNLDIVADSHTDLLDGGIDSAIRRDEAGTQVPNNYAAWTGSNSNGTYDGSFTDCGGWTSASGGQAAAVGNANSTGGSWAANGGQSCDSTSVRLYCFELVL